MSQSQLQQDLHVLKFFRNKKNFYFLDIGANDGKTLSNTYFLEKQYNWTGICSEPEPSMFKKLIKCRTVICDKNAVYNKSNLKLDFSNAGPNSLFSGITTDMSNKFGNNLKIHEEVSVNTITLQDLLEKYKSPNTIHYLSLDTEGSEYKILTSINFKIYKFMYINVEHNYIEPQRTDIKNLLVNNGYLYKGENKWDDDYIHETNIIGIYYFNKDFSKPIKIEKSGENAFICHSSYWSSSRGYFDKGYIIWDNLPKGKIFHKYIEYDDNSIWES